MKTARPHQTLYGLPGDAIQLQSSDRRTLELADRLWERASAGTGPPHGAAAPMRFCIDVRPADPDAPPRPLREQWDIRPDSVALSLGDRLQLHVECVAGRMDGRVDAGLLAEHPSLVARLLLEVPAALLLARRGYGVLHAGAVVGPAGAVVIRGAPSAGKSTLVAGAHCAGFDTLGDESVLVAREDPDNVLSAVRDVTLLPDATRLLGLEHVVTPAWTGTEDKQRLDLFLSSTPSARRARRIATVLLGARNGGLARLEALAPEEFMYAFRDGEIPQERWSGTPPHIAEHWSRRGVYRLSGTADLAGAVEILAQLVGRPAPALA